MRSFDMDAIERVTEIAARLIRDKGGFEIIDITYKKEGPRKVLRVLLDREGGISLGECGKLNNDLGALLDSEGVIDEHYVLEVSSPGLDRPIKTDRDFERSLDKVIKVTTYAPFDGKNVFCGRLLGLGKGTIVIEDREGISTEIPRDKIANAKLEITFSSEKRSK